MATSIWKLKKGHIASFPCSLSLSQMTRLPKRPMSKLTWNTHHHYHYWKGEAFCFALAQNKAPSRQHNAPKNTFSLTRECFNGSLLSHSNEKGGSFSAPLDKARPWNWTSLSRNQFLGIQTLNINTHSNIYTKKATFFRSGFLKRVWALSTIWALKRHAHEQRSFTAWVYSMQSVRM